MDFFFLMKHYSFLGNGKIDRTSCISLPYYLFQFYFCPIYSQSFMFLPSRALALEIPPC